MQPLQRIAGELLADLDGVNFYATASTLADALEREATPSTRTLQDIVAAVRSGDTPTYEELRYAVVAFDVLLAQLDLPQNPVQLAEFFKAAETAPKLYAGDANDPQSPAAREWYAAFASVKNQMEKIRNDEA